MCLVFERQQWPLMTQGEKPRPRRDKLAKTWLSWMSHTQGDFSSDLHPVTLGSPFWRTRRPGDGKQSV